MGHREMRFCQSFPAALNMSAQDAVYPWPQQQLSTTLMSPPHVTVCSNLFFIRTVHLSTTPVVLLKSPHQQWAQGNALLPEFPAALNMSAQDAVYPWPQQQQLSTTLMSPPHVTVCSNLFFIRTVHLSTTPVVLLKSPHQQWAQGNVLLPEFPAALNISAQDAVYPWPQQQLGATLTSPPYVISCCAIFCMRAVHLSTTLVVLHETPYLGSEERALLHSTRFPCFLKVHLQAASSKRNGLAPPAGQNPFLPCSGYPAQQALEKNEKDPTELIAGPRVSVL